MPEISARLAQPLIEGLDHELGLVLVILRLVIDGGSPISRREKELLFLALGIIADDRLGGLDDGLGGTVVLLELEDLGAREIMLEPEDVPDIRPPPAVDGLVRVPHHAKVILRDGRSWRSSGIGRC